MLVEAGAEGRGSGRGEALKCNHCVPPRPGGSCTTTEEECSYDKDACISASFLTKPWEALKCNRCVPPSGGSCRNRVEECGYGMDACIRATFLTYPCEALKCNRCVPLSPGGSCITTEEECGYGMDACINAIFLTYPYSYFQRCIQIADCWILQQYPSIISTYCCNTDLCN
ncbi:hypothetical protein JZ751_000876 [Albula glossodonta]|uniref:UPAR/Ly6 domain-containing protein n=1 Tax=Albula glossodonta TaxID=121402 RepID=A0A8T2PWY8_9TELE|nr:hypothetical protein JZ751_000876 [Albula glossodonta]